METVDNELEYMDTDGKPVYSNVKHERSPLMAKLSDKHKVEVIPNKLAKEIRELEEIAEHEGWNE